MIAAFDVHVHAGTFAVRAAAEIPEGWTVLMGPSGAGKSTLLRAIAGLVRPVAGTVRVGDAVWFHAAKRVHVPAHKRRVGWVAQNPALFPHMTALENVMFGVESEGREATARHFLQMFHAEQFSARLPGSLSGGEKQRVAIARALARQPKWLLLDEPFRGLDLELRDEILEELRAYVAKHPLPVLAVFHDPAEADAVHGAVLKMQNGRLLEASA